MSSDSAPPTTIQTLLHSVYPAFALIAGMRLDLFTPLRDGPLTAEELADALAVDVYRLRPLLYALVAAGALEVNDARFGNTAESDRYLVQGKDGYLGATHEFQQSIWQAVLKTADTIRTGEAQAKHDYSALSLNEQMDFFRGLHPNTLRAASALLDLDDFTQVETLVDVGSGSGGIAIGFAEALPTLRATAIDLPNVVDITRRFVEESGASDRIRVDGVDVTKAAPSGAYDVAVARAFTQVLGPEDVRASLMNVGKAIRPGGLIYLITRVLDDSRTSPSGTVGFNLVFVNFYDRGEAYTEAEYRGWLAEAGFDDFTRHKSEFGDDVIRAQKRID